MFDFVLSSPGRVFLSLGGFDLYTYGIVVALAILSGVLVSNSLANRFEVFSKDVFIDFSPWVILIGFLGARLWYCAINAKFYLLSPISILNLRDGGISIHGAILGGLLGLIIYAKKNNLSILKLCDFSAIGLALGQAIGRWGNFFNNEAFGLPKELGLKLFIPVENRPQEFLNVSYFHPTFLYECIADFCLFILLYRLLFLKKIKTGILTFLYLLLYSLIRFSIELIRIDSNLLVLGLPFPAFVSCIVFIISLIGLISVLTKVNN